MKKKLFIILLAICALSLISLSACEMKEESSLKTLTNPYIAQYECTEARFGNINLLDYYDYIRLTLVDKSEINVVFKQKNGERSVVKGKYNFDQETRELTADIGILGYNFKEKVKIEKGGFTISKPLGTTELVLKFEI